MEYKGQIETTSQQRWHDVAYWALLIVAGTVFLVMNFLTTFKEDDMLFSMVEGEWTPVRTLADALRSHYYHFCHTNGRLADVVPEFFCGLAGKTAFNVCNTLVFVALLHLLSLLVTGRRSVMVVALFLAVVGTCFPVPGETMLWIAGSANYLWAITLSLALVYYLQGQCRDAKSCVSNQKTLGWGGTIGLLLFAVVAGGFNEGTSFGFFGGMCAYYAFNRSRFDRRAAVALLGSVWRWAVSRWTCHRGTCWRAAGSSSTRRCGVSSPPWRQCSWDLSPCCLARAAPCDAACGPISPWRWHW